MLSLVETGIIIVLMTMLSIPNIFLIRIIEFYILFEQDKFDSSYLDLSRSKVPRDIQNSRHCLKKVLHAVLPIDNQLSFLMPQKAKRTTKG